MRDKSTNNYGKESRNLLLLQSIAIFAAIIFITGMVAGCSGQENSSTLKEVSNAQAKIEIRLVNAQSVKEKANGWFDYRGAAYNLNYKESTNPQVLCKEGLNDENIEKVKNLIADNALNLELVDRGFSKKNFQVIIDYKRGAASKLPNLLKVRRLAYFLSLAGDYELHRGHYTKAAKRYLQAIHLGNGIGKNGCLIMGMVGIATEKIGIDRLKEMLNKYPVDSGTLSFITTKMEEIDKDHFTFKELLDNELLAIEYTMKLIENDEMNGRIPEVGELRNDPAAIREAREIYGQWYLQTTASLKDKYQDTVTNLEAVHVQDGNKLIDFFLPNCIKAYQRYTEMRVEFEGTMILAAIKNYKATEGIYPDTLSKLEGTSLAKLPKDPYTDDGEYIYRQNNDGIALRSVGQDLDDDGGILFSDRERSNGDLVFAN